MEQVYIIHGEPIPLYRPRFSPTTQRVYDSQKNHKLVMGLELLSQHRDHPLMTGSLHLDVTFFMTIPKKYKKILMADIPYHSHKPDLDNLLKMLCDILNGVIIIDDAMISKITASKIYDAQPRTEFTLKAL